MSYDHLSPIILFVYNRPNHTRCTIEALLLNSQASSSDLIIFSDAARESDNRSAVDEVRAYLETISGFNSVTIHHRPHNFGLSKSIIEGVTNVLSEYECAIILEDDMVTSTHFLSYMNESLEKFAEDERVISIHGYVFPVEQTLPEAFFLLGADCWGWATWRRGWYLFNSNGRSLLNELKNRSMNNAFDFNGSYGYTNMLENQIKGKNDSWAIRWYASAFLAGKLTLYPGRSLVHNIGNDNSGTHCTNTTLHDIKLSQTPIDLNNIEVKPSEEGRHAFEKYFQKRHNSPWLRFFRWFSSKIKIATK